MRIPQATLVAFFLASLTACFDADLEVETAAYAVANPDGTVICHKDDEIATGFASVPAHLAHGDFLGPCDGDALAAATVLVCHVSGATPHEIEVAFAAVRAHLAHGDHLGPCTSE